MVLQPKYEVAKLSKIQNYFESPDKPSETEMHRLERASSGILEETIIDLTPDEAVDPKLKEEFDDSMKESQDLI